MNTLNAELLSSITNSINDITKDGAKAAVLTSGRPGVFSAGLDIMSMYGRNDDELRAYWTHVQAGRDTLFIITLFPLGIKCHKPGIG